MDINELDLSNIARWPAAAKAVVILFLMGSVIFLGYWFHSKDQLLVLEQFEQKEQELKKVFEKKARQAVNLEAYEKQNPRDFTLLRRATLAELKRGGYLKTSWGNVLPSLHLETVALTMAHLGGPIDIHISSLDFLFPHNENEIAIAQAVAGKPLANYCIHCENVLMAGRKM